MAKRRTAPKVTAQAGEARRHRREVMAWARAGQADQPRQPVTNHEEPLTSDVLKQPGGLERVLTDIKQGFVQADQRHRTAIDHEVMRCVRVARFLYTNLRQARGILGGKWLDHWRKHEKNKSEALRFVFQQTHTCAKKSSLYYRAMYKMFDENVRVEDISARVTEGGGYQALADANVRFPRKPRRNGEGNDEAKPPSKGKISGRQPDPDDKPLPSSDEEEPGSDPAEPGDDAEQLEQSLTLVATFDEDGRSFLDLPLPCYASVVMHVAAGPGGTRSIKISHVEHVE